MKVHVSEALLLSSINCCLLADTMFCVNRDRQVNYDKVKQIWKSENCSLFGNQNMAEHVSQLL